MKRSWNQSIALLTVSTLLAVQLPSVVSAQVTPTKIPVTAATEMGNVTFTRVGDGKVASYTPNASSSSPGYLYRFISEPLTLNGVDASHDYYYNVPKATLGTNNYLELSFSHSELLIDSQSTLTVSIDDKPIKSLFLTEETSRQGKIRIPLGPDETKAGYHKITVSKHSLVSDDLCNDDYNPANWLKVDQASSVFIDTKTAWSSNDLLNDFPHPFVEPGVSSEVYGAIVVPDTASPGIVSSALELATSLSSYTAAHNSIPVLTESEWAKQAKRQHVIALGGIGEWKGPIKQLVSDQRVQPKEQALSIDYFSMQASNSNQTNLLMLVTATEEKTIQEKIGVLTDSTLTRQLSGNQMNVHQTPVVKQLGETKPKQLTLSSSGYDHVNLNAMNDKSNNMRLTIPSSWKVTGDGSLDLKLKVSPLLLQDAKDQEKNKADKSNKRDHNGLTVYVNGVPSAISLAKLAEENKESDVYTVSIPISAELLAEEGNVLTVSLAAHMEQKGAACYRDENNGRWIFVDKESVLNVPHEVAKEHSFQYWPAPFADDQGPDRTAFLLPENVGTGYLSQLSMLANDLVVDSVSTADIPVFREPLQEEEKKQLAEYNLIAVGDLSQFPSLREKQTELLVQTEGEQLQLAPYSVLNETTMYAAWIQPSPWNKENALAIFQSADRKMTGSSNLHPDMFTHLKTSHQDGQVLVMSKSKEIFTIDVNQKSGSKNESDSSPLTEKLPLWLIVLMPTVFIGLLIIFLRMWRKKKLNNSDRRE
ncbi:cellulose biosynthesis cyclic di-GMP-binding regulatory protein BcsB [Brevibacillus daliensis]|uniref:cellulose biosynthesis cyclic di-GMP-binding regulatory protein BcsB n=1 Tax=Brevibacillus daliensis TaxID=2892995 RepID=UPI001E53B361|nr:cellulose biosynthesis cyclic di-GMP-binding regulatory protein BcsB [Brevibacillus daliensis]